MGMSSRAKGDLRRRESGLRGRPKACLVERVQRPSNQAARPVEYGESAVGIFVNPDLGANEVGTGQMRWDLQAATVPSDRIIGSNRALLLDREDRAPLLFVDGHKSGAGLRRGDGETGIVGRQIDLL